MESTSKPQISIVIPVYNAGGYLRACLDSILSQSFADFEVVTVDDGSTDESLRVLQEYAARDQRVRVHQNEKNLGISRTLNAAISFAKGDYICRMDADDIMLPGRLAVEYNFLQHNPEYILVGGHVNLVTKYGSFISTKTFPLDHQTIRDMLFIAMPVQHGTLMINRTKLPEDFVWYEDGMNTAEEVELLFKLLNYGKFKNLDQVMIDYRQHQHSLTHSIPKEVFHLTYYARQKSVREHGYRPTPMAAIINELQNIVIKFIPGQLILPLFYVVRKIMFGLGSVNLPVFSSAKKAAKLNYHEKPAN